MRMNKFAYRSKRKEERILMGFDRFHLRRRCSLLIFLLLLPVMTEVVVLAVYAQDNGEGMRGSNHSPPAPQANNHEHQTPKTGTTQSPTATSGRNQEGLSRSCSSINRCRSAATRTVAGTAYLRGPPPPPFVFIKNRSFPLDPPPRSSSPVP